jgi:hypothetical protein
MKRWLEYSVFKLFSNRKWHGLGPWLVDQHMTLSMVDWPPWPAVELTEAWPSVAPGHGVMLWGGEKKEGATGSLFWLVSRLGRRRTNDGTSAQKGDGVGVVRAK